MPCWWTGWVNCRIASAYRYRRLCYVSTSCQLCHCRSPHYPILVCRLSSVLIYCTQPKSFFRGGSASGYIWTTGISGDKLLVQQIVASLCRRCVRAVSRITVAGEYLVFGLLSTNQRRRAGNSTMRIGSRRSILYKRLDCQAQLCLLVRRVGKSPGGLEAAPTVVSLT